MNLAEVAIKAGEGDEECILKIIEKFMPSISKFSKELGYEEAETDFIISLLESMIKIKKHISLDWNDGMVVNFLYTLLKNKKIDLFRKNVKGKDQKKIDIEKVGELASKYNFVDYFIIDELLELLTIKQQKVLKFKYFYGYSDVEIAKFLDVSRQSVNKIKIRAIKKLRGNYFPETKEA